MWIIAIASPNVLGDDIQGFSVVEMRASSVDLDVIERYKTTSPIVFNEYKAIQNARNAIISQRTVLKYFHYIYIPAKQ